MADFSFPAHITAERVPDLDGLPILSAHVSVSDDVGALPLPLGPAGPAGKHGRPRSTFRKAGTIPDVGARPTGLGAEDRGRWWHRLDDNGMDVWTGSSWEHSPAAVGPKGPVAEPLSVTAEPTRHHEALTEPAVHIETDGVAHRIMTTAAAGLRGPQGPVGQSAAITAAPDFDSAAGPGHRGVFSYNRAGGKFRGAPAPLGSGPWGWYETGFVANTSISTNRFTVGEFTIPAQPFAWRPIVNGHLYVGAEASASNFAHATVRLHNSQGQILADTLTVAGPRTVYLPLIPIYSEENATRNLSPSSTYATVAAGESANLVVSVERYENGSGAISFTNSRSSMIVYARPI
jgi:hypothetical protein